MRNFSIKIIPHSSQRYNTVGDYQTDSKGNIEIRVSDLGNPAMERLVALHELIEIILCKKVGVTEQITDTFDFEFAKTRLPSDTVEPGDDPRAPYYTQHQFATKIEKMMCEQLELDWEEYGKRVSAVMTTYPRTNP